MASLYVHGKVINLDLQDSEINEIEKNPDFALEIIRNQLSEAENRDISDTEHAFDITKKDFLEVSDVQSEKPGSDHEERLLRSFISKYRGKRYSGVSEEICLLAEDRDAFIRRKLLEIEKEGKGIFLTKAKNGDYVVYLCERRSVPHGNSSGLSSRTRANGCKAYVSFTFTNFCSYIFVIIRKNLHHTNHDLNSVDDKKVARISPELILHLQNVWNNNMKAKDIIATARKWAFENGHRDANNRRFFPSVADIRGVVKRHKKNLARLDSEFTVIEQFISQELKDEFVFYQAPNYEQNIPFIAIMMSERQKQYWRQYGELVTFIDTSYSESTKDYIIVVLSVLDGQQSSVRVAYFIMNKDLEDLIAICFLKIKEAIDDFYPKCFMLDKNMKIVNAVQSVFSSSHVFFCSLYVIESVSNWLNSKGSNCSGRTFQNDREKVLEFFHYLSSSVSEEMFTSLIREAEAVIPRDIWQYLLSNWVSCGYFWSYFGRKSLFDEVYNAKLEKTFMLQKNHYLKGRVKLSASQIISKISEKQLLCCDYCGIKNDGSVFMPIKREVSCLNCDSMFFYSKPKRRERRSVKRKIKTDSDDLCITSDLHSTEESNPVKICLSDDENEYITIESCDLTKITNDYIVINVSPDSDDEGEQLISSVIHASKSFPFARRQTVVTKNYESMYDEEKIPRKIREFKVFSLLRKELGKQRPIVSVVSMDELRRRTEGPEGCTKFVVGRLLRSGAVKWKTDVLEILKHQDLSFSKRTKIMSSFTYLTEGDCNALADDTAYLLHKYYNSKNMLESLSGCPNRELLSARDVLKHLEEDFASKSEMFDLVTHTLGNNLFSAVIDFIATCLEHQM